MGADGNENDVVTAQRAPLYALTGASADMLNGGVLALSLIDPEILAARGLSGAASKGLEDELSLIVRAEGKAGEGGAAKAATSAPLSTTDGVAVSGRRATDRGASYEQGVRGLYPETSLAPRRFEVIVDGKLKFAETDSVTTVNGQRTAVEAKYVDDWTQSPSNPASPIGQQPWAIREQQTMVAQAERYTGAFAGGSVPYQQHRTGGNLFEGICGCGHK